MKKYFYLLIAYTILVIDPVFSMDKNEITDLRTIVLRAQKAVSP